MWIIRIVKLIIACLPFAGMLLLVKKCNLRRANRGRQVAMPLVALIYSLVIMYLLIRLGGVSDPFHLESFFTWLTEKVPFLATLQEKILNVVRSYLTFLTNAAAVLFFLAVKGICLPIFSGIWGSRPKLMENTAGLFYEYDEDYQLWFLQERMRDFQKLMRTFYLAAFLIGCVSVALAFQFPSWRVFQAVPYPCFAVLILGEINFLLKGYTRTEYEQDVMGDDALAKREVHLSKLRELLRQLFGDRLLLEGTELENSGKEGVTDLLETLTASESATDRVTGEYFEILRSEGVELDVDNIISARSLLEGKNVLFCNPFYKDLTQYFLLPMSDTLMHRRKCLVVAGRKSTEPEIRRWLEEALQEHLKMSGLWRVGSVADADRDYEIGILSFSQLYDLDMLSARRDFFHTVGFVLMLEPSLILATGQVGLSLVVNYCDEDGSAPTYCMCDRNCDGLVDTLSHMIKHSITDVSATENPTCQHTEMCWNGDGPYLHQRILPDISRYLGVGTELAAASVKDQVPRIVWRSEKKFPVVDMKWIVGQYYPSICRYANLPMNQESVYNAIGFEADLWGTPKEKTSCMIVEDEFCNLLELVRLFTTRAKEEAFVNVISEDYLLRGYMQHNYRIFSADRKAIPTIVADYARTERNATMRLMMLLLMSESVPEETVEKELRLVGTEVDNACDTLNRLIHCYTLEQGTAVVPELWDAVTGRELESGTETRLRLRDKEEFVQNAGLSFQTAYFITEDDKENSSYMDAKLFGHIFQYILPGQFFTYDGKYYEVRSITSEKGVLVRRAADHIVGRRYYRQKRSYHLEGRYAEAERSRHVNGLEITTCAYDFMVYTEGYLELDGSNDLRRAREVRIADSDRQDSEYADYSRLYRHKNVLRIRLPECTEEVRYTICLLLMEIFRTVYADDWHYLAAVTAQTELTRDALRGLLYTVGSEGDAAKGTSLLEEDCIYIIEDSDVDMGLLESVDRNLSRLLGIVTDFLDWHTEMANTPDPPPPVGEDVELPPEEKHGILWHIKQFFRRIGNFFKRLFHIGSDDGEQKQSKEERKAEKARKKAERQAERERKKAERQAKKSGQTPEEPTSGEAVPEDDTEELTKSVEGEQTEETEEIHAMATPGGFDVDIPIEKGFPQDDFPGGDIDGEDEAAVHHGAFNRYMESCFLRFGYDEIDPHIAVDATLEFLNGLGFGDNELHQVRKGAVVETPVREAEEQCDFCGLPLSGVAYDVLTDGRVRCAACSATAIHTVEQFRALYQRVLPTMEGLYDIRLGMPVRVRTADAKVIAKQLGSVYKPTKKFDARAVGFARMDRDGFAIYIENGAPRLAAIETISHELTHIWQYVNWDQKGKRYGKGSNRDIIYEGMAMWASVQFLYLIGEGSFARRKEEITLSREDAYGEGFRLYCQKYPLSRSSEMPLRTPFHTEPPL